MEPRINSPSTQQYLHTEFSQTQIANLEPIEVKTQEVAAKLSQVTDKEITVVNNPLKELKISIENSSLKKTICINDILLINNTKNHINIVHHELSIFSSTKERILENEIEVNGKPIYFKDDLPKIFTNENRKNFSIKILNVEGYPSRIKLEEREHSSNKVNFWYLDTKHKVEQRVKKDKDLILIRYVLIAQKELVTTHLKRFSFEII